MQAPGPDQRRDPQRRRLRGVPPDGRQLGAPARVPDLRPRGMLRLVQEQARDRALPPYRAPLANPSSPEKTGGGATRTRCWSSLTGSTARTSRCLGYSPKWMALRMYRARRWLRRLRRYRAFAGACNERVRPGPRLARSRILEIGSPVEAVRGAPPPHPANRRPSRRWRDPARR